MKTRMATDIPLAIVIFAAVAAVAPGRPDNAVEQREYIFHELHADGLHALCGICSSQYWH
jgi:hypothetical protein